MRMALCDDDRRLVRELTPVIYKHARERRIELVIDEFRSGEELLKSRRAYDMVFLDYQMGGIDGLDAARMLREKNANCAIVFMTGFPDFVYDAFEVNAFRFMKKPVTGSELLGIFDDYFKMYGSDYPIVLRHEGENITIDTGDILYLEAAKKLCLVHTVNGSLLCTGKNLRGVYGLVPKSHFFRIHASYVVNFNHIAGYRGCSMLMKNGDEIIISRARLDEFRSAYMEYSDLRNLYNPVE